MRDPLFPVLAFPAVFASFCNLRNGFSKGKCDILSQAIVQCNYPFVPEFGRGGGTGLNSTSLAMPGAPMMEMAWSMPPDSVPTYFSQLAVKVATSCTTNM